MYGKIDLLRLVAMKIIFGRTDLESVSLNGNIVMYLPIRKKDTRQHCIGNSRNSG